MTCTSVTIPAGSYFFLSGYTAWHYAEITGISFSISGTYTNLDSNNNLGNRENMRCYTFGHATTDVTISLLCTTNLYTAASNPWSIVGGYMQ